MKTVLFISWSGAGHCNPLIATAEKLVEHGQRVAWICVASADVTAQAAMALGDRPFEVHVLPNHPPIADMPKSGDLDAYVQWSETVHFARIEERVGKTREIVRRVAPDVIAVNGLVYEGIIAAELERIPYASVSNELTPLLPADFRYPDLDATDRLRPPRERAFARFGLAPEFRCHECLSPHLNVVFTTDEFIADHASLPPRTKLVGPAMPASDGALARDFPWDRLDSDRGIVYAAFGTLLSPRGDDIRAMTRAVAELGLQLVVAIGEATEPALSMPLPDHVVVVPFAPQRAVLERARAFITHGGANSVMEAMYHGVPLIVTPLRYDQPLNAHFVARAGVGIVVPRALAQGSGYAPFLASLLESESIRSNARRVRDSYRRRDGAREAAMQLLAL
jgi:zeaxanthin glucosyltransferase